MTQRLKPLLLICFAIILMVSQEISANAERSTSYSISAPNSARLVMFDESLEWATSRAATDSIIAQLVAGGIDVYVPCVWHGRGTYYPSPVADPDTRIAGRLAQGEDPLKYLVDQAHKHGIAIHIWFTVVKREDNTRPLLYSEGSPTGAYDIHIPAFRDFITQLIIDAASRYDVDGVNLDYIRSMGLCTSEWCIKSYQEYLKDATADLLADNKLRYLPAIHKRLGNWNQLALADIVQRIRSSISHRIELSVDAHPLNRDSELQGQYPITWANSGLIDRIFDMRYQPSIDYDDIARISVKLNAPDKLAILLSNIDRANGNWVPRPATLLRTQIMDIHSRWPNKWIGIYHRPRITEEQLTMLHKVWR